MRIHRLAAPTAGSGGQLILAGRYSQPGPATLVISGDFNGVPFETTRPVSAPELATDHEFVKYVWATEKVGTLLADMSRAHVDLVIDGGFTAQ